MKNEKQEETLSTLLSFIAEPVVAINSTGSIFAANQITEKYTELKINDFVGKNLFEIEIFDKELTKIIRENLKKRLSGVKIRPYEIRLRGKNGKLTLFEVNGKKIEYCNQILDVIVFHDVTERVQRQKKLQNENEERFYGIANSIRDALILIDEKSRVTYWNPAAEKIFGYTSKETIGRKIHELVVPNSMSREGKEQIEESVQTFSDTGLGYFTIGNVEVSGRRKNGSEFPAELSISPIKLCGKWNAVGVVKDITARKQADQRSKDAEQRYHALFNQNPLGVLVVDPKTGTFVEFNEIAHLQLGYLQEEFEQITIFNIENKKTREEIKAHLKELTENGSAEFETEHRTKNGEIKNVIVTTRAFKSAEKTFLHCIFHDVTEWKTMEENLRQERDMLENMASNIDAGIAIIDRDYRIIWANQRLKKQKKDAKIENTHCFNIYNPDLCEVCEGCGARKIFEDCVNVDRRDYHIKMGDKEHWIELTTTPVKDKEGNVIAALELSIDITERKMLQNKLREYSQKLEEVVQKRTRELRRTQAELVKSERLAAIGELAGMIGHDLRNPLSGIKNAAYYMKKKGTKLPPKQSQEMLETIEKCVDYSNRIINDLLDYSRELNLEIQEETSNRLLKESIAMINIPNNIKVENKLDNKSILKVDINKIKRVFINIIKNAIDAMPNGGKIIVKSTKKKNFTEISFTDTGTGISDDILPTLFSPLITTKAKGMGFGLAICKRIIEAHNGMISVETIKNKGATFTITIPDEPKPKNGGENVWIRIPESLLLTMTKPSEQQ